MTTFLSSVELPMTQPFPTIALPLINAHCLISASSSMMQGPFIYTDGNTVADFAIHISSPLLSNLSAGSFAPSFTIKSAISGSTSHGYVLPLKRFAAIVSSSV